MLLFQTACEFLHILAANLLQLAGVLLILHFGLLELHNLLSHCIQLPVYAADLFLVGAHHRTILIDDVSLCLLKNNFCFLEHDVFLLSTLQLLGKKLVLLLQSFRREATFFQFDSELPDDLSLLVLNMRELAQIGVLSLVLHLFKLSLQQVVFITEAH